MQSAGNWNESANAGSFYRNLTVSRSDVGAGDGFRACAYVQCNSERQRTIMAATKFSEAVLVNKMTDLIKLANVNLNHFPRHEKYGLIKTKGIKL